MKQRIVALIWHREAPAMQGESGQQVRIVAKI